jgi:hypothetical protein
MSNLEYLAGPAAENMYYHLVTAIRALADPGEELELPAWTEARAWSKAYRIYQMLQHRQKTRPPDTADPATIAFETSWNQYLGVRHEFLAVARKEELTEDDCRYLGLIPGDLNSPTTNDQSIIMRYGVSRHPDWQARAFRINAALVRWEGMSPGQKAAIPLAMAARRAEARTKELQERISNLESISNQGVSNV